MANISKNGDPARPALARIAQVGVVPVVVLQRVADAVPLAQALVGSGLPVAEVTFRTPAAADAIRAIVDEVPGILVGAGTVASAEQVDAACAAGAQFVVTPGFNRRVVERCLERRMTVIPGVSAPGFVEMALEYELRVLKFFPAEAAGGLPMLKALAGPYRGVRFMPTGGIGPANLRDYLAVPAVMACGGSWMVEPALIEAGDFSAVQRLSREAVQLAAAARTPTP